MKKGLKWLLAAGITACLLGIGMMAASTMMVKVNQQLKTGHPGGQKEQKYDTASKAEPENISEADSINNDNES